MTAINGVQDLAQMDCAVRSLTTLIDHAQQKAQSLASLDLQLRLF